MDEIKISLKISSKLEFLMKSKKVKGMDIAKTIHMTEENFSYYRNKLKKGKLPSSRFLVGITKYFEENFLN